MRCESVSASRERKRVETRVHAVLGAGRRVLSCLTLTLAVRNREITTIEGLVGYDGALHPMQRAFVGQDALRCRSDRFRRRHAGRGRQGVPQRGDRFDTQCFTRRADLNEREIRRSANPARQGR
jgi:hypothetical protein